MCSEATSAFCAALAARSAVLLALAPAFCAFVRSTAMRSETCSASGTPSVTNATTALSTPTSRLRQSASRLAQREQRDLLVGELLAGAERARESRHLELCALEP